MNDETEVFVAAAEMLPDDFYQRAASHFLKAVRKHPRFADSLWIWVDRMYTRDKLARWRRVLKVDDKAGVLAAENLLHCEILEAAMAHVEGDAAACVDELYDAVAVLMRMIAVVEGKQRLGGAE